MYTAPQRLVSIEGNPTPGPLRDSWDGSHRAPAAGSGRGRPVRTSAGGPDGGGSVTLGGLLSAAWRRWPVSLLGLVLTVLAATQATGAPGRYESYGLLTFLTPLSTQRPDAFLSPGSDLISAAGVMAAAVEDPAVKARMRAAGLRDDYTVVLHNEGTQNADNFDRPVLDLFVSGSDPDSVERSMAVLVAGIDQELARRQAEMRTAPRDRIRTELTPGRPPVLLGTGSPLRAGAAAALLGIGLTLTVALLVDDAVLRRRHRRTARGTAKARTPAGVS